MPPIENGGGGHKNACLRPTGDSACAFEIPQIRNPCPISSFASTYVEQTIKKKKKKKKKKKSKTAALEITNERTKETATEEPLWNEV